MQIGSAPGVSGGMPFVPGPLVSGVGGNNNDTFGPQAPQIGAMIIGDSAPLWDVLTIGAANTVLVANGTPGWAFLTALNFGVVAANLGLFGPVSGAAATPTFRALVTADIPTADGVLSLGTNAKRLVSVNFSTVVNGYGAAGDANPQASLALTSLSFGPGGAAAVDVSLKRTGVGIFAVTDGASGTGLLKKTSRVVSPLIDAATIAIDASAANVFTVTVAVSRILGNPSNAKDGDVLEIVVTQGGAGTDLITYDTKYRFGTTLPSSAVVWSTAVGAADRLLIEYDGTDDKFDVIGFVAGFN